MQQCGSSSRRNCSSNAQMGPVMPYSCDLFQAVDGGTGSFSIFFATSAINEQQPSGYGDPSSSPVDCTLSLGTPSTRHLSGSASKPSPLSVIQRQKRHNYPLCLDFLPLQPKRSTTPSAAADGGAAALGAGVAAAAGGLNLGRDPLLRRCANCDATSTPLWRNGPRGPKSLCNACGIRFKKEERRAASSAVSMSSTSSSSSSSAAAHMESLPWQQQQVAADYGYHHPSGYSAARVAAGHKCPSSTPAIFSAISQLRENVDPMEATALSYLPWQRFNPMQAAEFATSRFQD